MSTNERRGPVVAIDGPAGAGKSTVASHLAKQFGLLNLETGAMYRSVALKCNRNGIDVDDAVAVAALSASTKIELEPTDAGNRVFLDGEEVTGLLRTPENTALASRVSVHPAVRQWMVSEQRAMGERGGVVMEGRDIGTAVFPDADVKIFLDASPETRGDRRYVQNAGKTGESLQQTIREVKERDDRDRSRAESPLKPADDAILIDTTRMTLDQVLARASELVSRFVAG